MRQKKYIPSAPFTWKKEESWTGFTLLELLISIVIVSIILSIMFGAIRLGIRAWEKGENDTSQMRRVRIVKNHIKWQISSICTKKLMDSDSNSEPVAFALKGTNTSIEFLSNYSILPDTVTTPVYVKYFVQSKDTDDLVLFEKEISTLDYQSLQDIQEIEESSHVLLEDIYDIGFEYLKRNIDGTSEWQNFWNTGLNQIVDFPAAVKLNFFINEIPVSLVVKILSEYEMELK